MARTKEQISFYKRQSWVKCRNAYMSSVGGLCEKCKENGLIVPAVIVHHKEHITGETMNDPEIAYNFDNLIALCRYHHGEEHSQNKRRYIVDEMGHIIPTD